MDGVTGLILSLLMIAGFVLVGGGIHMLAKRRDRTKGVLMIVCGLVMWGNVAVTQAFLTLSEVLGHLDLLVERGQAVEEPGEELTRFRAV